jgi:DNA-binding NtrC family response regulator
LRERTDDVPELVQYFLRKYGPELGTPDPMIHPEALQLLQTQSWPGNVRELENSVRKVLLLSQGYAINVDHVRSALAGIASPSAAAEPSLRHQIRDLLAAALLGQQTEVHAHLLDTVERELFSQAIQVAQGNQARAARLLGVSRLTMQRKLTQFGLHPGHDA